MLSLLGPRLMRTLQGIVSPMPRPTNKLDVIQGIIRLLDEAGSVPSAFDAKEVLHCDMDS